RRDLACDDVAGERADLQLAAGQQRVGRGLVEQAVHGLVGLGIRVERGTFHQRASPPGSEKRGGRRSRNAAIPSSDSAPATARAARPVSRVSPESRSASRPCSIAVRMDRTALGPLPATFSAMLVAVSISRSAATGGTGVR